MSYCDKTCKYFKHCWFIGESLVCEECNKCQKVPCDRCEDYEPERPHGEWLEHLLSTECSVCHKRFEYLPYDYRNFCPNCGADMRKEGDEK